MKLRKRLIISFCLMLIIPIGVLLVAYGGLRRMYLDASRLIKLDPGEFARILGLAQNNPGVAFEFILCTILILVLTAGILVLWTFRGMSPKLQELSRAAENIKNGNLDFDIKYTDEVDELGELCAAVEDMRRRLQENAEEKLKAEQEQRDLISNIAHDLKTPITTIKGYSEGILDGVADTPEKQEKYLRTIHSKAGELNNLINELTLYSQIDSNRIPYDFQKVSANAFFEDCITELGFELESQHIGLNYRNFIDPEEKIIVDPKQLMRVVQNIIGNSIKYMSPSRQPLIEIVLKDVGDYIQIDISDNGRGIAAEDLPYIFDRFYRGDASRNTAAGGSGIGLSIVKKIVDDQGGKIWATSKEGEGTTMSIVLRKYQEVVDVVGE